MYKILDNQQFEKVKQAVKDFNFDYGVLSIYEFIAPLKIGGYAPRHRKELNHLKDCYTVNIGTFIYQILEDYTVFINEEQKEELIKVFEEVQSSERYKKEIKEYFNCFGFTYTVYLEKERNDAFRCNWWVNSENPCLLPFDADEERIKESIKNVTERAEKAVKRLKENGIKVHSFSVNKIHKDTHFIIEELEEIKGLFNDVDFDIINPDRVPKHQSRRVSEETARNSTDLYKEITLKSTKRKMLFYAHQYGYSFAELSPVIK